jgi:oligoendopeptidase F
MSASPAGVETDHDRWNLAAIYPDGTAWEAALQRIEAGIRDVASWRGRLSESAASLCACLDTYFAVLKELYRASSYASMRYHEDTRHAETAAMEQRANLVGTRLSEAASFVDPEILALGRTTIEEWLREHEELKQYSHMLDDTLRRAAHTRSPEEEEIIATAGLVTDGPYSVSGLLANADAPWPDVRLSDGTQVQLNQAAFAKHRAAPNRDDRRLVFEAFWAVWAAYARSFGGLLYSQVKRDLFYARVRDYPNSLAAALDSDRIPEVVYRTLIEQANANLPVLHRYFRLRQRILGLDELRYFDIYPPLVRKELEFPVEQARGLVLESLEPLGEEVVQATQRGFDGRWVDVHPRQGKRAGAYMNGHVYDVHPYILLNYNGDYESVSTLAHEWGHAVHSYLANQAQGFANAEYSIFVAEVASTLAEALLLERMLGEAGRDTERLFYLGHALEQLRGTFFRQTMFAEFELAIHSTVEKGEALTGDRFSTLYGEVLKRYHGHTEGVVVIDDEHSVEWAYIPHFYYNFYVYQYATSVAASSLIAERVLAGDAEAVERYLELLRAGGNGYPFDLLLEAGVDLATPEPYEALMRRMGSIMDEIEAILDRDPAARG